MAIVDPKSWGEFIKEVGIPGATIFALLAILGYLAFQGVPAVVQLTDAIKTSAVGAEQRQASLLEHDNAILANDGKMIDQHSQILAGQQADRDKLLVLQKQTCINTAKSLYQAEQCR